MPNYAKTWTLSGRTEYQAGIVFSQTNINPEACTSNIYFELYLITTENDADEDYDYKVTINGTEFSGTKEMKFDDYSYGLIVKGNVTLNHPADGGAASFNYSVSLDAEGLFFGHAYLTAEDSYTFSGFSRQATISFVNAFTDEENITIGYSNPAKSAATVEACISMDGGTTDTIKYKPCDALGSMFTFELTEADRNILRAANKTGTKASALFVIKTTVGDNRWWHSMWKEYDIINPEPTLSPSVKDANSYIVNELTGNDQKFILGHSNAYFNTGADPKKQATIDHQWIRCGSTTLEDYTQSTGTINKIDSNTFYFEVTNSRGYKANDAKVLDIIPYTKLTASLRTGPFNANGTVRFTISGMYFDGDFGKSRNSMQVQYCLYRTEGDNRIFANVKNVRESGWVELGQVQPTTSNGTYTFSHTVEGLDYNHTWTLEVAVQDALTPLFSKIMVVAPLPTFDWSDEDFHHHTDVKLSEGARLFIGNSAFGEQKLLWSSTGSHMNGGQSVSLYEEGKRVSDQANGIVLVFSLFRGGQGADASFNTFFVSKKEVELFPGLPHTYLLGINSGFSKIGAKYLTIYDDHIDGNDTNALTGTNSGITFDNASFVLRAVIGV
jgi:hypothetical protein